MSADSYGYRKTASYQYGAVEPHDIEEGRDLTETKSALRIGDGSHPRASLLAAKKHEELSWWQRTRNQLGEVFTKDRIVAMVIWLAVLVFIILIVVRIVHVEKQKHKHH